MRNRKYGFTLVEVLLVSAMFAVISLAVFNAFSNGFKLWARGQHVMVEGNLSIFLDRIGEDLRSTVINSNIPFKGQSTEFSFPALILAPTDKNGSRAAEEFGTQIGAVRYIYDPLEKKIYRSQAYYGQAIKSEWQQPLEVASMIEDVSLRYYFKADRGLEVKSQSDQGTPMGVMIDVSLLIDGQISHIRRFLLIPVGGAI